VFNIEQGGDNMTFDYSKLDGKITEVFGTRGVFAANIRLSERSVSLKMNGIREWKQHEIANCCEVLGIEPNLIHEYFFATKVQN